MFPCTVLTCIVLMQICKNNTFTVKHDKATVL